jgi:hypothetical protein
MTPLSALISQTPARRLPPGRDKPRAPHRIAAPRGVTQKTELEASA